MKFLRGLWDKIKPVSRAQWIFSFCVVAVLAVVLIGTPYVWDYTNSSPFCGMTCHTMPPHYESYQRSPHARVECTECHIGRTFVGVAFTRKAVDAQFVWAYATGNYEYPIFAKGLQPARESCEKCHWTEKFSWDKVVTLSDYQTDAKNSLVATTLLMKIGGGSARTGLGRGIHWHVENVIEFKYTDKLQQQIPWVSVTMPDGKKIVYTDIESKLSESQLAALPSRQMDCIDCHNRISHKFESPSQAVDAALQNKQFDASIPEINKKAVEVLTPHYKSDAEAKQAIGALDQFYKQNYASFYSSDSAKLQNAIKSLQDLYPRIYYRDQELDWTTHPDNIGHKEWAGCFRCHDGKHFTADRKESVRLECNVCHTIPQVALPGAPIGTIPLERGNEPASHKATTWLAQHRTVFDSTCQGCHNTNNAGGKDDTSFCSNSACHGTAWKFAGLNAPEVAKITNPPVARQASPNAAPAVVPHPIGGNPDCQLCHGEKSKVRPFPANHAGRKNDTCLACHKPTLPAPTTTSGAAPAASATPAAPAAGGIKQQPADHAGRTICLACHQAGLGPKPPADHAGRVDNTCAACHTLKK